MDIVFLYFKFDYQIFEYFQTWNCAGIIIISKIHEFLQKPVFNVKTSCLGQKPDPILLLINLKYQPTSDHLCDNKNQVCCSVILISIAKVNDNNESHHTFLILICKFDCVKVLEAELRIIIVMFLDVS